MNLLSMLLFPVTEKNKQNVFDENDWILLGRQHWSDIGGGLDNYFGILIFALPKSCIFFIFHVKFLLQMLE